MNGFTRLCGYLGLTVLLGGVAILAITPQRRFESSSLRDNATTVAIAGYLLVVGRLGYLTFNADGWRTRLLAGVAMFTMLIAGVGGFIGIELLLTQSTTVA